VVVVIRLKDAQPPTAPEVLAATRPGRIWQRANGHSSYMSETEDDRAVSTVPLDTEDGGTVVISQQNVGPANEIGGGEFKNTTGRKTPEQAADEQYLLQGDAPVKTDHDREV
jgi:hypothetical protein